MNDIDIIDVSLNPLYMSASFLGIHAPRFITPELEILLTSHTYLPKDKNPYEDRVVVAGIPAFYEIKKHKEHIHNFATIGTGAGLDALAAIEILHPKIVMMTDLHQDVVDTAYKNVSHNLTDECKITLLGKVGELGAPLIASGLRYDIVYENLPNIPLLTGNILEEKMNSSSFIQSNAEAGLIARQYLLELHEQLLVQSKSFLTQNGQILSTIGARVQLSVILDMAKEAGCRARILIYTWKIQTEAKDVIRGYAQHESLGKGPFYFYALDKVKTIFSLYESPAEAAIHAFEIERKLKPYRITATDAANLLRQTDITLCHTVVVTASCSVA